MRVTVRYFAQLREQRGLEQEQLETSASTPEGLYEDLRKVHGFVLRPCLVRAAVNGSFVAADHPLQPDDEVVFVPPVAGG